MAGRSTPRLQLHPRSTRIRATRATRRAQASPSPARPAPSFLCQLDGGGFTACTSPKSYSGLADGAHSFQVKARDAAGNDSSLTTFGWTIDATAPAAPSIDTYPADPTSTTGASFTFSGEAGASFLCQLDGGGFSACTSPKSYSGLAEGAHSFQVKAQDAVGNESTVTTFGWTIDTTPPAAPSLGSHPSDPSNSANASFDFSGEAGASFLCDLDGSGFTACTSPKSYSGLADGAHSFTVKARDAAGNESTVTTFGWAIDATPPAAPSLDSHPADPSNSASASFTFSGEAGASFLCQLDGGGFTACTSPKSYSGPRRRRTQLHRQGARRGRQRKLGHELWLDDRYDGPDPHARVAGGLDHDERFNAHLLRQRWFRPRRFDHGHSPGLPGVERRRDAH